MGRRNRENGSRSGWRGVAGESSRAPRRRLPQRGVVRPCAKDKNDWTAGSGCRRSVTKHEDWDPWKPSCRGGCGGCLGGGLAGFPDGSRGGRVVAAPGAVGCSRRSACNAAIGSPAGIAGERLAGRCKPARAPCRCQPPVRAKFRCRLQPGAARAAAQSATALCDAARIHRA